MSRRSRHCYSFGRRCPFRRAHQASSDSQRLLPPSGHCYRALARLFSDAPSSLAPTASSCFTNLTTKPQLLGAAHRTRRSGGACFRRIALWRFLGWFVSWCEESAGKSGNAAVELTHVQPDLGAAEIPFGPAGDPFGRAQPRFGHAQPHFGYAQNDFGTARNRFNHAQNGFGYVQSNFGHAQIDFRHAQFHFDHTQSEFGYARINFGYAQSDFGSARGRFWSARGHFECARADLNPILPSHLPNPFLPFLASWLPASSLL